MFNEANEPSSACRLWRIYKVETGTPPFAVWSKIAQPEAKSNSRYPLSPCKLKLIAASS
jgi:hypothetical protein